VISIDPLDFPWRQKTGVDQLGLDRSLSRRIYLVRADPRILLDIDKRSYHSDMLKRQIAGVAKVVLRIRLLDDNHVFDSDPPLAISVEAGL
jgi:hypothetical protein